MSRRHERAWFGGEGGIRTHGRVTPTAVFETARFGRSRTSPFAGYAEVSAGLECSCALARHWGAYREAAQFSIGFLGVLIS
jgi:hypothetical protein